MTPKELFHGMRELSLPPLTAYHPSAENDGPDLPWLENTEVGVMGGAWGGVRAARPADLYPATPLERSQHRPDGYALWDFIVRNGWTAMRAHRTPDGCGPITDPTSSVRGACTNTWWYGAMQELWMSGSVGGDTPDSEAAKRRQRVVDTGMAVDYNCQRPLLEMAHALAHHWTDSQLRTIGFWGRYTFSSRAFLEAAAGLAAATIYGLPVNPHDREQLLPHGLRVNPTVRNGFLAGKPVLQIPYLTTCAIDQYIACLNISMQIGNDPIGFLMPGTHPSPADRYAYEPSLAVAVGWETPAWVYGQDICRYERISTFDELPGAFTAAGADLMPPQSLRVYLEAARPAWPVGPEYRPVSEWLKDPWLRGLVLQTPPLPCLQCLLLNRRTEQGLRLPGADILRSDRERTKYESMARRGIRLGYLAKVAADRAYKAVAADRRDIHNELIRGLAAAAQLKDKELRGCRIRY